MYSTKNKIFKIIEVFHSHSRRHIVEIVVHLHSFVTTALFGGTNVTEGLVSIRSGHNYLLPFVD